MKLTRWPKLCTRCGSIDHFAEDCDMPARFGISDAERDLAAEERRDRQTVLAALVAIVVAYIVISALGGVTP